MPVTTVLHVTDPAVSYVHIVAAAARIFSFGSRSTGRNTLNRKSIFTDAQIDTWRMNTLSAPRMVKVQMASTEYDMQTALKWPTNDPERHLKQTYTLPMSIMGPHFLLWTLTLVTMAPTSLYGSKKSPTSRAGKDYMVPSQVASVLGKLNLQLALISVAN